MSRMPHWNSKPGKLIIYSSALLLAREPERHHNGS